MDINNTLPFSLNSLRPVNLFPNVHVQRCSILGFDHATIGNNVFVWKTRSKCRGNENHDGRSERKDPARGKKVPFSQPGVTVLQTKHCKRFDRWSKNKTEKNKSEPTGFTRPHLTLSPTSVACLEDQSKKKGGKKKRHLWSLYRSYCLHVHMKRSTHV